MKIDKQIAIITGAASGLGAATAKRMADLGAKVIVADFDLEGAKSVANKVNGVAFQCDVSNARSVERMFDLAKQEIGIPRILVSCAGIAPAKRIVGREGAMPLEEFSKVIEVNLVGTFNILRVFAFHASDLPELEDGERGVIINTASAAAFEGQIGQAAYASSKGGVLSLTLPAARELAKFGIRVMTIAPGTFETPMLASLPNEVTKALAANIPFPTRLGRADEYAKLAIHIVENVMLNGETIRLDGALRMAAK